MTTELFITFGVLAAEIGLFIFCMIMSKRPVKPGKVRLVPYSMVMVLLTAAIFATIAHAISLITGEQVMPKRRRGM